MSTWLFFPDYRASVPYQSLLADALAPAIEARPGTVTDALESVTAGATVFHLHWEDAVYFGAAGGADAAARIGVFLASLDVFRDCGGRLVWTLHNAAPHEDRFPVLSADFRRALAQRADLVHVHGEIAAGLAREAGTSEARIVVVPLPDLARAYPNDITDEAARRYFGLAPEATVFAFIGAMRGYKGLETLLRAFARVHATRPAARLILAGRQAVSRDERYLTPSPGVLLIPRFVDDAVVQYVLRAADYVVLPYRRILTSGAVALALGFARPVIVPDLPPLLEVVQPGRDSLTFELATKTISRAPCSPLATTIA
jgi:glycosyltransferase involved in cell wall biosynthesis